MSKQSYMAGFCKAATAKHVDPKALARFAVEKAAADAPAAGGKPGVWENVLEAIYRAKDATQGAIDNIGAAYVNANPATKALIGTGVGSALGTGIGAALAGKKGLRSGSIIGALAGAGVSVDWNALAKHFGEIAQKQKAESSGLGSVPTTAKDIGK